MKIEKVLCAAPIEINGQFVLGPRLTDSCTANIEDGFLVIREIGSMPTAVPLTHVKQIWFTDAAPPDSLPSQPELTDPSGTKHRKPKAL